MSTLVEESVQGEFIIISWKNRGSLCTSQQLPVIAIVMMATTFKITLDLNFSSNTHVDQDNYSDGRSYYSFHFAGLVAMHSEK